MTENNLPNVLEFALARREGIIKHGLKKPLMPGAESLQIQEQIKLSEACPKIIKLGESLAIRKKHENI